MWYVHIFVAIEKATPLNMFYSLWLKNKNIFEIEMGIQQPFWWIYQ